MPRDTQIRERLFPGVNVFNPSDGGYAAFPFVLRRVQFLFDPRSWQIYSYIVMRIGPAGIGWLTMQEMSWDLGFRSIPKLKAYVDGLVKQGWLRHQTSRAREYFVAPHPVNVLRALLGSARLPSERVEAIDELLESLDWDLLLQDDHDEDEDDDENEPKPIGPQRGVAGFTAAVENVRRRNQARARRASK